jgi:hypothetical protein
MMATSLQKQGDQVVAASLMLMAKDVQGLHSGLH